MKLCTFSSGAAGPRVGVLGEQHVADLTGAGGPATMPALIEGWPDNRARLEHLASEARQIPREHVRLLAPVPRPGKVLCSGINYHSHFAENPHAVMPSEPFFFAKLSTSVCGHGDDIVHPARTQQLDYEVEFAVVIGRALHRADEADVMAAVFGYTLLNDVSARDVQFRENQITLGKNFDGFAPIGPCITTADEIADLAGVGLRSILNGKVMQDGSTADWVFSLQRLLAFLSHTMALEPGDIVSTGTPAGVGLFQQPPVFMQPGDVIAIEADGVGRLENRIVAATGSRARYDG